LVLAAAPAAAVAQAAGGVTAIPTIAALRANTAVAGEAYIQGYYASLDGGEGNFWLDPADTTSADNGGTIIVDAGNHRWHRQDGKSPLTPKMFGCYGDAKASDTTGHADTGCMINALAASAGSVLYLGPFLYKTGALTVPAQTTIQGAGTGWPGAPTSGFIAGGRDATLLTLGTGDQLRDLYVGMGNYGQNTGGTGIVMPATAASVIAHNVWMNNPCNGIEIEGTNDTVEQSNIDLVQGASCSGVLLGPNSNTRAQPTAAAIDLTTIKAATGPGVQGGVGMSISNCGGCFLTRNDIILFDIGTLIQPGSYQGVGQAVSWLFADNTVLGDTVVHQGLLINTASPSAIVQGAQISASWAATQTGSAAPLVQIENTGGGTIEGVYFNGDRFLNGDYNLLEIDAGTDVRVDASTICGGSGAASGIYIGSGVGDVAIRGSRVGGALATCGGVGSRLAQAIGLGGGNGGITIVGNDLSGAPTPLAVGGTGITGSAVIADNVGLDQRQDTVAAADRIAAPFSPVWRLTGSTAVATMANGWVNRQMTILPGAGVHFRTGGNVCAAYTATAGVPIIATFSGHPGCWYLK
jgi:hypothetical protein